MAIPPSSDHLHPDPAQGVLRGASLDPRQSLSASSSASPLSNSPPTSESILSAYSNPSTLHPLSNLNSLAPLDYLALDDTALSSIAGTQTVLPNRGWSDELCYGTGTVYVGGLIVGGLWGLRDGWSRSQAIAAGRLARFMPSSSASSATIDPKQYPRVNPHPAASSASAIAQVTYASAQASQTSAYASTAHQGAPSAAHNGPTGGVTLKLRLNSILNGITRRGSFVGNTSGVLALMYNIFNCTLDRYRNQHDNWNSVLAGGLTGALFRCTAGPQKMIIASSLMAGGAMVWSTVKPSLV